MVSHPQQMRRALPMIAPGGCSVTALLARGCSAEFVTALLQSGIAEGPDRDDRWLRAPGPLPLGHSGRQATDDGTPLTRWGPTKQRLVTAQPP